MQLSPQHYRRRTGLRERCRRKGLNCVWPTRCFRRLQGCPSSCQSPSYWTYSRVPSIFYHFGRLNPSKNLCFQSLFSLLNHQSCLRRMTWWSWSGRLSYFGTRFCCWQAHSLCFYAESCSGSSGRALSGSF